MHANSNLFLFQEKLLFAQPAVQWPEWWSIGSVHLVAVQG